MQNARKFFWEHESGEWREFFASRGMRGNFLGNTNLANGTNFFAHAEYAEYAECAEFFGNTNLANGTKDFFGGLSIFVALAECVVNEGGVDVGVRFRF